MLSEATRTAIRSEVERYPHKKTALLPSLKLAQREAGWLSKDTLAEVADLVGVPHSSAVELATFYSMLFTAQVPRTRVEVCVQLPCALVGAEQAAEKIARAVGAELHGPPHRRHGVNADGTIEVGTTVECYGACHRAPMCRVGDDYVEHLHDDDAIASLAADLKKR
ncbi:MAG: NAD(P)H-dependent oxidoreductase subunit E [Deltaproteobacteria bacterium]|nr:NAD(P)H-dependent oxidoreductase subunit E [Deltaproteobacteria bacterium]